MNSPKRKYMLETMSDVASSEALVNAASSDTLVNVASSDALVYVASSNALVNSVSDEQDIEITIKDVSQRNKGLSYVKAAFFLMAQLAGAGFLILPKAMAEAGWSGIFLTIFFCISVGFSATRLGQCWVILEERWEEYRKPTRQPYMDIAYKAFGINGRRLSFICLLSALIGSTIVFLILISEMMSNMIPVLSKCQWVLITAAVITPFTWLGTPKDFWQVPVLAVAATTVAVIVIVVKILLDKGGNETEEVTYPPPTISSFSLAFGAILFSFGGSSVFPTIQNDMKVRTDFWKSVLITFSEFGWGRTVVRTGLIMFHILVALAIPDFSLVLNLVGGSAVGMLSCVFPPLMYMKLIGDTSNKGWPKREISTLERVYLWLIVLVGIVGGICASFTALRDILSAESFQKSCFLHFGTGR